jgi:hypothetical protein
MVDGSYSQFKATKGGKKIGTSKRKEGSTKRSINSTLLTLEHFLATGNSLTKRLRARKKECGTN